MVSERDVNGTQWVAEKNGTRKYPTNACVQTHVLRSVHGGEGGKEGRAGEREDGEQGGKDELARED